MAFRHDERLFAIALIAISIGLTLPAYRKVVAIQEGKGIDLPLWKHVLLFIAAGILVIVVFVAILWLIGVLLEAVEWVVSRLKR